MRPADVLTTRETITVTTGITVFGCAADEAALFERLSPHYDVVPTMTEQPASVESIALVRGNRCISVGHKTPLDAELLRALSAAGVEYVSTRSSGYNHIDVDVAASVGITVGNVVYAPDGVADFTLMLMLMSLRRARTMLRGVDARDYRLPDTRGRELGDLTVGVVGTGRIGSAVIDRLRGFGCRVLAYDSRPVAHVDYVPLEELLQQSDIVTLHTPLTAITHHLLDQERIAHLKPGAIVVNTGRGGLIETEALLIALESGALGGAALDVVEGEEGVFYTDCRDVPASPLLARLQALPQVLISPHTAFHTERALQDTVENSLLNCLRFESGRTP